ncbi:glycoside hydrolase [Podospora aff. communis PSN243]|uniref:Endo-1,4-beta-xylanase n=1 Tax=Podospora aff. communis PSN243 TaxID=3040156 RepID=A0AAV9G2T3_9PEZI|nr:glycoside hydrolase [Podospora aff. communis PSN243]
MITLKTLLLTTATTALAGPLSPSEQPPLLSRKSITPGSGTHDGFFYHFWSNGCNSSSVAYANGPGGSYSVTWKDCMGFVAGKGWTPGVEDRNVTFAADFNPWGNDYLSVYGWTRDPQIEYYVVENWGTFNPTGMFGGKGVRIEVDGGWYTVGLYRRVPIALGGTLVTQVFSVRDERDRRNNGTVTLKRHFEAWKQGLGVKLGTMDYQILALEGYMSSGEGNVTVFK